MCLVEPIELTGIGSWNPAYTCTWLGLGFIFQLLKITLLEWWGCWAQNNMVKLESSCELLSL